METKTEKCLGAVAIGLVGIGVMVLCPPSALGVVKVVTLAGIVNKLK